MSSPKIIEDFNPMLANKHLMSKTIYTFEEGKKLGVVKDVLFDENFEVISGLSLGKEGLFSRSIQFVPLANIKVIGVDTVIIDSESSVQTKEKAEAEALLALSKILKKEIVDRGIKLAVTGDVAIAADSKVMGLKFSKVLAEGKIESVKILSRDAITDICANEEQVIHADLDKF
jgi:sporulation protein YlmC with PRC-barrel domain